MEILLSSLSLNSFCKDLLIIFYIAIKKLFMKCIRETLLQI